MENYHGFQGDVILVKVDSIPKNCKISKRTHRGYVLAEGEVTGHAHTVAEEIKLMTESNKTFIHAETDFEITHEEHDAVTVPAGDYEVRIANEYDHFAEEAKKVAD